MRRQAISAIFSLALLGATSNVLAEPLPEELRSAASEFVLLEEAFRESEWDEAKEENDRLKERLDRLEPRLMAASTSSKQRDDVRGFSAAHAKLAAAIAAKDGQGSEAAWIDVQKLVIGYVELFDYTEHPLLSIVIEEFEEMSEEVDFANIEAEAEEMEEIFETLEPVLIKRGASKETFESIEEALAKLEENAKKKDEAKVLEQLEALQKLTQQLKK